MQFREGSPALSSGAPLGPVLPRAAPARGFIRVTSQVIMPEQSSFQSDIEWAKERLAKWWLR